MNDSLCLHVFEQPDWILELVFSIQIHIGVEFGGDSWILKHHWVMTSIKELLFDRNLMVSIYVE